MSSIQPTLSKSRVIEGLQCPKALWLSVHGKDLAAPVTPEQQAIFDQGTHVGELARKYFGEGTLIEVPHWEPEEALARTRSAIDSGALVLFEAAFRHDGVLVRVDILRGGTVTDGKCVTIGDGRGAMRVPFGA